MLLIVSLGSLLGVTTLHYFSVWPPSHFTLFLFTGLAALSVVTLYRKNMVFLLSFCIGWGWAYSQVSVQLHSLLGVECRLGRHLEGEVVGITQHRAERLQFDMRIKGCKDWKARLYWNKPESVLQAGDEISVEVKLKKPWGMANPGGFDLEKQMFIERIAATGQVIALKSIIPTHKTTLSKLRQSISENISAKLGGKPLVGVIQAMTVGIRSGISVEEWRVFQATGTSHVVAISGLHVGLVAIVFTNIIGFCVRRNYRLTSILPAQGYAAIAGMSGAILYSAAAGFSIPTQRACIMVMVVMIAKLKRRPIVSWQTLAYAWLAIAVMDPFAPLQMGFWLSFGCVTALILGRSHYQNVDCVRRWLLPQCVVFFGLMPLGALFFHQIPIFSPLANLIFIPIVSFIIVPFSLLGVLGIPFCLVIAHTALALSWPVLKWLAMHESSIWYLPEVSLVALGLSFLGTLLLLMPRGFPARHLGWVALLSMFFVEGRCLPEGSFYFTLLDVGQGLAAVIQTKQHTLLYDAGPVYSENQDAGGRVIRPFLNVSRIDHLDKIIISHSDLDHRGGLNSLHTFSHTDIVTSEPERLPLLASRCVVGEQWEWDGVHFEFLNPILNHKKRNNISCVLKVSTKGKSLLLTGDIEALAERVILEHAEDRLKSDVLLVPHHGSLTSSSEAFIQAVAPTYALFAVGKDNRYQFPRLEILRRYDALGVKSLLAWQTGAILFQFGPGDELTPPIQWRDTFHHYWNQTSRSGESND